MESKIIKSFLSIVAVACFSFAAIKITDTKQVQEAKAPVLYMQVDPGGAGG